MDQISETSAPTQHEIQTNIPHHIKSHFFDASLESLTLQDASKAEKGRKILEEIDTQGVNNFSIFKSIQNPGIEAPFTKVDVTEVANKAFEYNPPQSDALTPEEKSKVPRYIYITFPGFGGNSFTAWDVVYDRVISELPKIASAKKDGEPPPAITVYSLGSPNSRWGKINDQWVEGLKSEGLKQYGLLGSEFFRWLMAQEQTDLENTHIIFHGVSQGTISAQETLHQLPEFSQKIRLLLDNPSGTHDESNRLRQLVAGLQIPLGFGVEALTRIIKNPRIRRIMAQEKDFLDELESRLNQRGIKSQDDEVNKALKHKAVQAELLQLIKVTPLDTENSRIYIRRGFMDPTTFSPAFFLNTLLKTSQGLNPVSARDQIKEFAMGTTHFIDRARAKKWARIIDFCQGQTS